MRHLAITIFVLGLWSCSRPLDKNVGSKIRDTLQNLGQVNTDTASVNVNDLFKLDSYLDIKAIDTASLLTIDFDCAFIIYPTDEQLEEMKKEYGEDDFFTIVDDGSYYHGTATGLLDSLQITTVSATKPFVRFIGADKTWTLNLTKKGLPAWNLIFFKRNREPEIIGTADLTADEINDYFKGDGGKNAL
jgi:hypothetical protein